MTDVVAPVIVITMPNCWSPSLGGTVALVVTLIGVCPEVMVDDGQAVHVPLPPV